ncbi:MAG TPA: DNA methyltransferase, partial [Holophagaceae bacterium]|nr:DNA methyltransferase [Holophagaceae bacterium]
YCFEKDIRLAHGDGTTTTGFMDLYRAGSFVLEAKQGGGPGSANARGTRSHERYMERAFGQARNYAQQLKARPPFLITCDIGHLFEVWEGFSGDYGGYARRRTFTMQDLLDEKVQSYFRTIWDDPQSLDPARRRARVTREVAGTLGALAKALEARFGNGEAIARFLMRCVFTFFAEDTGLLPKGEFELALKDWRTNPADFPSGLEALWDAMNEGGRWGRKKLLRFNGGLFAESVALELDAREIELLYQASRSEWADVDPSIFGTLLESALDPSERHRLGAHYTPRAFVERLLKPALEEPLRRDWELAQLEALSHLSETPTPDEKAEARAVLHRFQRDLAHITVLDPACGSGNFLAAAYDSLKRIEGEVQRRLADLGETARNLGLEGEVVTPKQFMGIEVKPWAAAIADMVLWICHLQWHRDLHPGHTPPEPVLQAYGNIACRDAVLSWSGTKATTRSRWDGRTMKLHPATGKQVPDETAQVPIEELLNPQPAAWPKADFIIGNPPFLGNKRMREALGDGYVEALRATYAEVPDSVDFVLYWWHRAAEAVRKGEARRFGLITTNSLTQTLNRRVIARATGAKPPLKLTFAIPDHPWHDQGAAVRIAMTVGAAVNDATSPWLGRVIKEGRNLSPEMEAEEVIVEGRVVDLIQDDLSAGGATKQIQALKANRGLSFMGVILCGDGFFVDESVGKSAQEEAEKAGVVSKYLSGTDLARGSRGRKVFDFSGLSLEESRRRSPQAYQWVYDHVFEERQQNRMEKRKANWWLFGSDAPVMRRAIRGLRRYMATARTTRHHVFQFVSADELIESNVVGIASEDSLVLGVLNSRFHTAWVGKTGATLRDWPHYTNSTVFDTFPFPDATEPQKARIRELAEALDAHRKAAQGRGVTITAMYNLRAKLRAGEALNAKEQALHAAAQTS